MIFNGKEMLNDRIISECGIKNDSNIWLIGFIRGDIGIFGEHKESIGR